MNDCTTCIFDVLLARCIQGHLRDFHLEYQKDGHDHRIPLQNCHAWQEKEKCGCLRVYVSSFWPTSIFNMVCKKCGRKYG